MRTTPARLFALQEFGNIYTRIMNPTTDVFEKRVAALEGGAAALATASGQAAETLTITHARHGRRRDRLHHLALRRHLQSVPLHAAASWASRSSLSTPTTSTACAPPINDKTRAVYTETLGNPKLDIADIEQLAAIAHEHKLPLVIDNTSASPALVRPIEWGADIVVNSATKFLGGHGTAIGGVIVDAGKFDWAASGRFKDFTEPDPSYHGLKLHRGLRPAGVHPQGARAGPARHRRGALAVQRVPAPAGH